MKITVIPTGNAPTHYSFSGEVITAHHDEETESFDLSVIPTDGKFTGVGVDTLDLPASQIVRDAYRDSAGELHVTLCQKVGSGHWETGITFDSADYNPELVLVKYRTDKPYAGYAYAITSTGVTGAQSAQRG